MALFNLRLTPEQKDRLETEARERGISRSDVTREALDEYFRRRDTRPGSDEDIDDDWADFADRVKDAHRAVLMAALDKVYEGDWSEMVESLYKVFRQKTIEKSNCYTNPAIFTKNLEAPYGAKVVAGIGFAADDVHDVAVDLEQLFFEYGWSAGDEAFDEIPDIWQKAKARLEAGEAAPGRDEIVATRY